MKRCPECRRDYYDDSLAFCLEDGAALIQGSVPSPDEPATQIISPHVTSEDPTRSFRSTDIPSGSIPAIQQTRGKPKTKTLLIASLAAIGMLAAGFFGYKFYSSTGSRQIESIAVMPFVNETGSAEVEYLSDGMTETLIKGLSNVPNLNVKPRSTVFRYKGKDTDLSTIARDLNVQAILNGRVTQRGDQLTLSLELIDVPNDKVIWTEQYQRRQTDLVSLQSEIARDVSSNIKAKLTGAEEEKITKTGTNDPEAYQAYLKGRYLWNRRTALNIRNALEQFTIATERDPNYALAFVGLADCYLVLPEYAGIPTNEALPKAKAYAERALALDSQLGQAHATLGLAAEYAWEWEEADKQFQRSISMDPNYPTAYHWYSIRLRTRGRFDESAAMIKRAQELDPVSSVIAVNVARTHQVLKDDQAAVDTFLKLIEMDSGFPPAHQYLALSYLRQGRQAEAVTAAERAVELSNRSGITLGDLGYVYGSVGKKDEATALLKELEAKYARNEASGLHIATLYVGLGERDKVFEWLEKDFNARSGQIAQIRWMSQFDAVRDDPRLNNLLRRMNLVE